MKTNSKSTNPAKAITPPKDDGSFQEGEVKTTTQDGKKMTVALVDGKFYAIASVQRKSSIQGSFSSTNADGDFLIIRLVVQNASKEGGTIATSLMKLLDDKNREFDTSSSGTTALVMAGDDTAELFMGEINPGNTKTISLVFDVPKDEKSFKLKIPPATFSLGKEALLPVPKAPYKIK